MNNRNLGTVLLVLLILVASSTFIVDEREVAIKFRLGEIVKSYENPGIYLMIPFINNVKKYDSRLLTMDSKPEQFLTSEKKNVIVDSFVKWRITSPENFYRASKGDERIGINRLSQIINDLTTRLIHPESGLFQIHLTTDWLISCLIEPLLDQTS